MSLKNKKSVKSICYGVNFLEYVINSYEFRVFLHKSRKYLIISHLDVNYNYNRYVFNIITGKFLFLSSDILNLENYYKNLNKLM